MHTHAILTVLLNGLGDVGSAAFHERGCSGLDAAVSGELTNTVETGAATEMNCGSSKYEFGVPVRCDRTGPPIWHFAV
jgi:hypothetical protein